LPPKQYETAGLSEGMNAGLPEQAARLARPRLMAEGGEARTTCINNA